MHDPAHYYFFSRRAAKLHTTITVDLRTTMNTSTLIALRDLKLEIEEAWNKETQLENVVVSFSRSLDDIDLSKNSTQPKTTYLDVLAAWKDLVAALETEMVYLQYRPNLETAFRNVPKKEDFRSIKTLLDLLTQSVQHHADDACIECRFVTLLEVMLSYDSSWKPSETVEAFWVRLMQRIPANIAPLSFRRRAYRVLVSLSWVPSSKGLLEACSFDEAAKNTIASQGENIQQQIACIRDGPLPRYDSVNQLLDRLKDETDVCVAISSKEKGMGKTVLACLVSSHPSIVRVFTVVWLNVKGDTMTYKTYVEYLSEMCDQMKLKNKPSFQENSRVFEEPALRKLRESRQINQAKTIMSEIVEGYDSNVLLILDDVQNSATVDLFRFHGRQSLIVTTNEEDLSVVDWTLQLVPMSEDEATTVFLNEAGLPSNHILGCTNEIKHIVKSCAYNPLTIRTVARWFQLKQVTAGVKRAVYEILEEIKGLEAQQDIDAAGSQEDESNAMLFDVLSLMVGPRRTDDEEAMTTLILLCFAASVVVFPEGAPLDAVLLLWEQVLAVEPLAKDEIDEKLNLEGLRRQTWFIAEALVHMGIVCMYEKYGKPWVRPHHALYKQFALVMADAMDLKETFEETKADWHMAFVTGYFSKKSASNKEKNDACWDYTVGNLPFHMLKGKMLSTAEIVLGDKNFFRARVEALGWREAIRKHVDDCMFLQNDLEMERELNEEESKLSDVFKHLSDLIHNMLKRYKGVKNETERANEESYSLYCVGFALAENGYHEEALEFLVRASELSTTTASWNAWTLYAISWCQLNTNRTEQARQSIEACQLAIRTIPQGKESLELETKKLVAEILVNNCDYSGAVEQFEMLVTELLEKPDANATELSTVKGRFGRLRHVMGDTEKAKVLLEECIRLKSDNIEISRSLSAAHSTLGDMNVEAGRSSEARIHYEAALQALRAMHCDEQHLDYRLLSGKIQWLRDNFPECQESLELVRATSRDKPSLVFDQSAYDLRCVARVYEEAGEVLESADVLRESLKLTTERQASLERAYGNLALGSCLAELGEDADALVCFQHALKTITEKLGRCLKVVDTMNLIGNVELEMGNVEKAIDGFTASSKMLLDIAPGDVERSAGVLFLLGEAHEAKNEHAVAASYYDRCMLTLKRDRVHDHPDIAKVLQRLGVVTAAQGEQDTALLYLSEALKIRKTQQDSELLAETLFSYGMLARKRGQLDDAEQSLTEAIGLTEKMEGNEEEIVVMRMELGNILRLQGKLEESIELFVVTLKSELNDKLREGNLHMCLGHARLSSGLYDDAVANYQEALAIRTRDLGKDDMRTANSARSLAFVKFLLGRVDESLVLLKEFVRVCALSKETSSANPDAALTKLLVGDILESSGKTDQARASWNHAKSICESISGSTFAEQLLSIVCRRLDTGTSYLSLREINDSASLDSETVAFHNLFFMED